ncbi:MAG: DUF3037 domain-containing protein [Candidatus Sulfotelmatobacter sp.]|jgi:DUF3037 family protein
MTASNDIEYCLLHYVPNVLLSEKSVSIAAILINPSDPKHEACAMICAADWQMRVRVLDPDADLEMLDSLLAELREKLLSPSESSDVIRRMKDSFSNAVQVSQSRICRVASNLDVHAFAKRLLEETSPNLSEIQARAREVNV